MASIHREIVVNARPEKVWEVVRDQLAKRGYPVGGLDDDQLRAMMHQVAIGFRDNAPTTAAQAATIILDGVRHDAWRILVGDDAHALDRMVRSAAETAYETSFVEALQQQGYLQQVLK